MEIDELIAKAKLPSRFEVVQRLQECIESPTKSLDDFAQILETDAGLTTRLLRLVNSAYYRPDLVGTVREACTYVGEDDLVTLVLATEIINTFRGLEFHVEMREYWRQNIYAAITARIIAKRLRRNPQELFTSTLLRNIGSLLIYKQIPDKAKAIFEVLEKSENQPLFSLEQRILGFDHATLSAELLKRWDVPPSIFEPIRYYCDPYRNNMYLVDASIVFLSNLLMLIHFDLRRPQVYEEYLQMFTMITDEEFLEEIKPVVETEFSQSEALIRDC